VIPVNSDAVTNNHCSGYELVALFPLSCARVCAHIANVLIDERAKEVNMRTQRLYRVGQKTGLFLEVCNSRIC